MKTHSMCAVFGVPGTYRAIQSVADGTAIPLHDVVIHESEPGAPPCCAFSDETSSRAAVEDRTAV